MKEVISRPTEIFEDKTELSEDFYEAQKDTYNLVNSVLKESIIARNSDIWLMFLCWTKQGKIKLTEHNNKKGFFINKENLMDLEKPSTIFRERRVIQNNENRLLPTDPKIIKERKIKQSEFKKYYKM